MLLSSPDVERMSHAMWLFEARALQQADRERAELARAYLVAGVKALRELLVALFGMNVGVNKFRDLPEGVEAPDDMTPFVPLIYSIARPDALKMLLERQAEAADIELATKDNPFDELSKKLANMEPGDMEPILTEAMKLNHEDELAKLMKALGVVQGEPGEVS